MTEKQWYMLIKNLSMVFLDAWVSVPITGDADGNDMAMYCAFDGLA